jgi:hypothetical protein
MAPNHIGESRRVGVEGSGATKVWECGGGDPSEPAHDYTINVLL